MRFLLEILILAFPILTCNFLFTALFSIILTYLQDFLIANFSTLSIPQKYIGANSSICRGEPRVRRKVSRVESLKRIIFSRTAAAAAGLEDKKRRSKSAEAAAEVKRCVDRGVGPDSGISSEDDIITPRASCFDLTSEIGQRFCPLIVKY